MAYFDDAFVSKQGISLEKYKHVMEHKFLAELNGSSQYTELWISKKFPEWFEYKILDLATNLLQWFEVLYPQKGQGALDHEGGELVGKKFMMGQIFEELVKKKGKACTMDGRKCSKPYSPNWKLWCVMDSKHNKCVLVVGWRQLGWSWCVAQGANQKI
jgi:hypothetical protein